MVYLKVGPTKPDNERFGTLLSRFRNESGFSRAEAAESLGVSSEYLRLIERGERTPAFGRMRHILGLYNVHFVMGAKTVVIDEELEVEFTSRILEARKISPRQNRNRSELLGEIVEMLVEADDELLDTVRMFLLVKARVA